jgi:hypothetical protein
MIGSTRVRWVTVELGDEGATCAVVGIRRHRMVTRRVPLATATALMARGVPPVVRHRKHCRPVAARA